MNLAGLQSGFSYECDDGTGVGCSICQYSYDDSTYHDLSGCNGDEGADLAEPPVEGAISLYVHSTDSAGNLGGADEASFIFDTTYPSLIINSPGNNTNGISEYRLICSRQESS